MSVVHRSVVCDRIRGQISLALDGELSRLESRMLAAHLARCSDCAAYEADVVATTHLLRAAPLVPVPNPVVISPGRRRFGVARLQVGVAAALVIAVVGAVSQIAARESAPALAAPARFSTTTELTREVNQILRDGRAFTKTQGSALPL